MPLTTFTTAKRNALRGTPKRQRVSQTLPPTARRPDLVANRERLAWNNIIGWVLLPPACLFALILLGEMLHSGLRGDLAGTQAFRWFLGGAVVWGISFPLLRPLTMIIYVFGHEYTHVLAAKMCGAKVYGWDVTKNGGWVDTDRSNAFISLAPYFVPIYTVAVLLFFGALTAATDLGQDWHLAGVAISPLTLLYLSTGFTWSFHFTYTLWTMKHQQTDLLRNGEFFSVLLIVFLNAVLVTSGLIIVAPDLMWAQAWAWIAEAFGVAGGTIWFVISWLCTSAWAEVHSMAGDLKNWGAGR